MLVSVLSWNTLNLDRENVASDPVSAWKAYIYILNFIFSVLEKVKNNTQFTA